MANAMMTYEVAIAAGRDAGNRHMRNGGRVAWDESDLWAAAEQTASLMALIDGQCQAAAITKMVTASEVNRPKL